MEREQREIQLNVAFPGFTLGLKDNPNSCYLVPKDERQWLAYFTTKELAELYSEQIGRGYVPIPIGSYEYLMALLKSDCPAVGIILNPLRNETWSKLVLTENI